MRVLHMNTTSHRGGAARAMGRLSQQLISKGHESKLLVGRSLFSDDPAVNLIWDEVSQFRSLQNSIKSRIGNRLERYIGINPWSHRPNLRISESPIIDWSDIIDLRNLSGGYFNLWSLPALSHKKPIAWRLPDLWALTGHCAYPYDCERWKTGCFNCPLLTKDGRERVEPPPTIFDGTRRVWRAKKKIYDQSQFHIIVTTKWMREQVSNSILSSALSVNVISNGVDLSIYKPLDRREARKALDLPQNERIILWAAGEKVNYRKGYHIVCDALRILQDQHGAPPFLMTMGSEVGWMKINDPDKIMDFGHIENSEKQALIYSAADVFLCTTLADAQPQTSLESLACGTPIIAFDVGPMTEIVKDGHEGYITSAISSQALSEALVDFYSKSELFPKLRENCRRKAESFYDLNKQTDQYIDLYQQILSK